MWKDKIVPQKNSKSIIRQPQKQEFLTWALWVRGHWKEGSKRGEKEAKPTGLLKNNGDMFQVIKLENQLWFPPKARNIYELLSTAPEVSGYNVIQWSLSSGVPHFMGPFQEHLCSYFYICNFEFFFLTRGLPNYLRSRALKIWIHFCTTHF